MNIFCGCSTLWLMNNVESGCGLFSCGSNVFRDGYHYYEYAEIVGSRTIIGNFIPLMVQMLLV